MENENELKFSFFIFQILRKMNWHSGTRILKNICESKTSQLHLHTFVVSSTCKHSVPIDQ